MLDDILKNASPSWMGGDGPDSDVVVSSRIRLARNIQGVRFTQVASPEELLVVLNMAKAACEDMNIRSGWGSFDFVALSDISDTDRQVLVEKHLISPQHAQEPAGRALMLRADESLSVMVNEEDHLRIQCLFAGKQLDQAWVAVTGLDDAMEARLDYAYDAERGYLTACPTNVGTGMRASLMLHLPALVITQLLGGVFNAASKVGMVVRGLYGEGTQALGDLFQLSNQITLGASEQEIIQNLQGVAQEIISEERRARNVLSRDMKEQMGDRVFRSLGILSNARILGSEEAMRRWSDIRLGQELGLIDRVLPSLNPLIVSTRPAFVQKTAGHPLSAFERDIERAATVRRSLSHETPA
jgi:protein arginine kinase